MNVEIKGDSFESQSLNWSDIFDHTPKMVWKEACSTKVGTIVRQCYVNHVKSDLTAINSKPMTILPGETRLMEFKMNSRVNTSDKLSHYVLTNTSDQSIQPNNIRNLIVLTSSCPTNKNFILKAFVRNMGNLTVKLRKKELLANVSLEYDTPDSLTVRTKNLLELTNDLEIPDISRIKCYLGKQKHHFQVPAISNLPEIVQKNLHNLYNYDTNGRLPQANEVIMTKKKSDMVQADELDELPACRTEDEIKALYPDDDDVANFSTLIPDIGFDPDGAVEIDPFKQVPFDDVEEKYRPLAKFLITRHLPLLSKGVYDFGNASATLGPVKLTLKSPLPTKSTRIYKMSVFQNEQMRIVLNILLNQNLIERTSASFGVPVFFVKRAGSNKASRLIADTSVLNKHLMDTPQILPDTPSLLSELAHIKPRLLSSVDLRQAFFSLRLHPKSSRFVNLQTSFGMFRAHLALQGIKNIPGAFSEKMNICLHSCPTSKLPDYIRGLFNYLDDIFGASGIGTKELYDAALAFIPELADLMQTSDLSEQEKYDAITHFMLMDEALNRLEFHGFKISPEKIELFQTSLKILGHYVDANGVKLDPKRLDKIKNLPMPQNRQEMMSFLGFLSSIKTFTDAPLAQAHAELTPLTSPKNEFVVLPRHLEAFNEAKRILQSKEFFRGQGDPLLPKLLFSDASDKSMGSVLMDIVFPEVSTESSYKTLEREHFISAKDGPAYYLPKNYFPLIYGASINHGNSSFFESITLLTKLMKIGNIPQCHKEMRSGVLHHLDGMGFKRVHSPLMSYAGRASYFDIKKWNTFYEKHSASNSPIDDRGKEKSSIILAAANFLARTIIVFEVKNKQVSHTQYGSQPNKPYLLLFLTTDVSGQTHYLPVLQPQDGICPFGSYATTLFDYKYMDPPEIKEIISDFVAGKYPHPLKAIPVAYQSKVFPENERYRAIYEKETQALTGALHSFRDDIYMSPIVIAVIDSRAVYFLFSPGIVQNQNKVRRHSIAVREKYPNLHLLCVPSNENLSDFLSRLVKDKDKG